MAPTSERHKGACRSTRSLVVPKSKIRIKCWDARTMSLVGKTTQITVEIARYIMGIWPGFGRLRMQSGETIVSTGRDDEVH